MAEGTPEQVARSKASFTGEYLRPLLKIELPVAKASSSNGHAGQNGKAPSIDLPGRDLAITPEGLKELRLSLNLSQAEAAQIVGVSRGLLAEAERGRRSGERTLTRIALGLRARADQVPA